MAVLNALSGDDRMLLGRRAGWKHFDMLGGLVIDSSLCRMSVLEKWATVPPGETYLSDSDKVRRIPVPAPPRAQ